MTVEYQAMICRECRSEFIPPVPSEWEFGRDAATGPCCARGVLRKWWAILFAFAASEAQS